MRLSRVLVVVGLGFTILWGLSTGADPSSAVGYIGRVSWNLAVGCLIGAALRIWWESR